MLKPIGTLAVTGVACVVLFKVLWAVLLPILALTVGLVAFVVKLALIGMLIWLGYIVWTKLNERGSEA